MTLNLNIKSSNGTSFPVQAEEDMTVGDFKKKLEEKSNIPAAQQRLIYSGHVLKDAQTLQSYGKIFSFCDSFLCRNQRWPRSSSRTRSFQQFVSTNRKCLRSFNLR